MQIKSVRKINYKSTCEKNFFFNSRLKRTRENGKMTSLKYYVFVEFHTPNRHLMSLLVRMKIVRLHILISWVSVKNKTSCKNQSMP